MLVLSRQRDETIMIGDEVEVTVVDIRGDKVRLGISAPKEVTVHRKEVYEAIKKENRAAAQVRPEDLPGSLGPHSGASGAGGFKLAGDPNKPQVRPTVRAPMTPALKPAKPDRGARRGNGRREGARHGGPSDQRNGGQDQGQEPSREQSGPQQTPPSEQPPAQSHVEAPHGGSSEGTDRSDT